jgi:pimeloyl-ACP methyl ester carboxylesterase
MNDSSNDIEAEAMAVLERLATPRRRARPRVSRALQEGSEHEIETPSGALSAWRVGEGPAVLMIHGWEDDNALWGPLADRFAREARPVVVFDLPGHGFSHATDASPAGVGIAALEVAKALGPIEAVVGHSYGCLSAIMAIAMGLKVESAVMIATPVPRTRPRTELRIDFEVSEAVYQRALEISAEGETERAERLEKTLRGMTAKALVIHSIDDEQTPVDNAYRLAELWPGAELMLADELGHRFVAQDAAVLERIVEFVEGYPPI